MADNNNNDQEGFRRRVVVSGDESRAMAASFMRERGMNDAQIEAELAKQTDEDDGESTEDPEVTAWLEANHNKKLS
jgi:hypothetical protein